MVNRCRVLFPPMHTKLRLIKQFAIALDNDGDCFAYMCQVFPGLTVEKLKAGILDGSQIQQLIRDPEFENSMKAVELEAGKAFVRVVETFLGNKRPATMKYLSPICWLLLKTLDAKWASKCDISIKMHYLFHLSWFSENLGSMSDEQEQGFHKDLKEMETRYQGRWDAVRKAGYSLRYQGGWDAVRIADYCWTLKRNGPAGIF